MTIGTNTVRVGKKTAGGVDYPYVEFAISQEDSVDGFVLEVDVAATAGLATTVEIFNLAGGEDIAAERAGNTHWDVNAGAAKKKFLGNLTFDYTTYTKNKIALKPGTVIGAVTIPAIPQPNMGFLFLDTDLKIVSATVTRRTNRMGG